MQRDIRKLMRKAVETMEADPVKGLAGLKAMLSEIKTFRADEERVAALENFKQGVLTLPRGADVFFEPFTECLLSDSESIRANAISCLGIIGIERPDKYADKVTEILLPHLEDEVPNICIAALISLNDIALNSTNAANHLFNTHYEKLLNNADSDVVETTFYSISQVAKAHGEHHSLHAYTLLSRHLQPPFSHGTLDASNALVDLAFHDPRLKMSVKTCLQDHLDRALAQEDRESLQSALDRMDELFDNPEPEPPFA